MTFPHPAEPHNTAAPSPSGIKVIVVGLGLAGLTTAVECHLKGHTVIAFEKVDQVRELGGDGIGIAVNAARVIRRWADGAVEKKLLHLVSQARCIDMFDYTGRYMVKSPMHGYQKGEGYLINRGELIFTLYQYAQSLGIDMRLGYHITDYWETKSEAGVIANGERVSGDCVIWSDGVHSIGKEIVSGQTLTPLPTGYATFRAFLSTTELAKDPAGRWVLKGDSPGDQFKAFYGPGVQILMYTVKGGKSMVFVCTHEDRHDATESWSVAARAENLLAYIEDWPCKACLQPVISKIHNEQTVDQKLVTRPPLKTWLSLHQRMMVIGDAAHPVLPMIGQGGGQAIEDGAVIAIALELAGRGNVPLGLRAAEKLRHPRATALQLGSSTIHKAMLEQDWVALNTDPTAIRLPHPHWILAHDCQLHAYEEFHKVVAALEMGQTYDPTNIPADGTYRLTYDYEEGKAK